MTSYKQKGKELTPIERLAVDNYLKYLERSLSGQDIDEEEDQNNQQEQKKDSKMKQVLNFFRKWFGERTDRLSDVLAFEQVMEGARLGELF